MKTPLSTKLAAGVAASTLTVAIFALIMSAFGRVAASAPMPAPDTALVLSVTVTCDGTCQAI
ncbi:MAG: hypothetical protein JSS46_14880 [Proteobacteria bacterium]|jgi:hypothetical protein|nr:hypothetical protein [Pseudomonadota bacterium]